MRAIVLGVSMFLVAPGVAQTPIPLPDEPLPLTRSAVVLTLPGDDPDYRIGPDDLVHVSVFEFDELDTSARVTARGFISLPLLNTLAVAGLTPAELEAEIETRLRDGFINRPQVTVFIEEYGSQPVTVMGAVHAPGVYQMQGRRYLTDMLAMAGGLDSQTAGRQIQIIRRPAVESPNPASDNITVDIEALFERGQTELNIPIEAGDTINVTQAGSIFVVGEVNGPGEFVLRNGRDVRVTQAVALGGGFTPDAKLSSSFVRRVYPDGTQEDFPIDLDKVIELQEEDIVMLPNDILFVPASVAKRGISRALDVAVSVATSRLVWGF